MVLGIAAGRFAPLPTGFWVVLILAALGAAVITLRRRHLHPITSATVALAVGSLGAVHLRQNMYTLAADHIVTFTPHSAMLATVRGQVVTTPQVRRGSPSVPGYHRPPRTNFIVRADSIRTDAGWQSSCGLVRVTITEPTADISPGQRLELAGRIGRFRRPGNPGQTDWSEFAHRTHVFVWMTVPSAKGATVLGSGQAPWPIRTLWRLRAATRQHLLACGDSREGHLLNALILGERDPALRKVNEMMVRAGIAHFLSISGLHLGIFLGFVYLLCRVALLRPRRAAMLVLVVLAAYVMLVEPRAPLLRSAVMAAALCLAVIMHRQHATLNALAAAAIILLAIDPLQLFAPGFQLSFVIVAELILLHAPARQWLFGPWLRRRGLMVFRHEQRVRRWLYFRLADFLMGAVTMCLTAYVVAAPLVAFHFGLVSPYAPLLSLVVFPLVLAVLVPGYLAMALAWPTPQLADSIQQLALAAADALAGAVRAAEVLPGLCFDLRPVGAPWTLLCYAAIVLIVIRQRIPFGRVLAGAALAVAVGLGAYTQRTAAAPRTAELDLLAVGAGQCAVLRTPSGQTWLIDAGTQSGFDIWPEVLGPFLRARHLPNPTAALVSHANTDHYNALGAILQRVGLSRVYLNEYFGTADSPPPPEAGMMDQLADHGVGVVRLGAGQQVKLDDHTVVEVLWPPTSRPKDLSVNDTSLVLRITCDGRSALLPGDLSQEGRARLVAGGTDLRSDVLVMPHHGAWTRALPEFFAAVAPSVVLISGAREPDRAYAPDARRAEFYRTFRRGRQYYTTPRDGWVHLRLGGPGPIRVQTMRQGRTNR